ncbi:MAG TPA: protein kinase [Pseudonocardia sp.]|nr:protein kinase [Pseudonocardia sp.]
MSSERFGHYELGSLLGRGGMGEVWRAYDTVRHREVALKRLQPHLADNRQFQARFRREAALAAQLHEPHVIPIHDYGEIDGRLFIDMRLVEGIGLNTLLAVHGPLPAGRAVHIVSQTAGALAAAHGAGLVHRDVKPSNVLLTDKMEAGSDFVYLVDFGVAHTRDATVMTSTGFTVGTLAYMAPERFDGRGDHRADVYALGCLLYETLTAVPPFSGEGLPALVKAHLSAPPPRPSVACRDLPAALDEVVATAMAKDPEDRYPSATALAAAARAAIAPSVVGARRGRDRASGPGIGPAPTTVRGGPAGHRPPGTGRPPLEPAAGRPNPVAPTSVRPRPEAPAPRRPTPVEQRPAVPRPAGPSPAGPISAGPPPAGLSTGRRSGPPPKSRRRSTPLVLLLVALALLAVLSRVRDHGDGPGHSSRPQRWEHGSSSHRH